MLDVKGQQHKARRLWASLDGERLWSRQLAQHAGREGRVCYLCGCCHNSAKGVTWARCMRLRNAPARTLASEEVRWLIETFHRTSGATCRTAGRCRAGVTVNSQWEGLCAALCPISRAMWSVAHALAD